MIDVLLLANDVLHLVAWLSCNRYTANGCHATVTLPTVVVQPLHCHHFHSQNLLEMPLLQNLRDLQPFLAEARNNNSMIVILVDAYTNTIGLKLWSKEHRKYHCGKNTIHWHFHWVYKHSIDLSESTAIIPWSLWCFYQ